MGFPAMRLRVAAVAGLLSAALLAGCAGRRTVPATPPGEAAEEPPWALPVAAAGSQRLFRVSYDGPEGRGGLRLTLRLAAPGRFQVTAADGFGRALWSLDLGGESGGLLIDHRSERWCPDAARVRVPEVALEPLPLATLPRLLLGRLPVDPAAAPRLAEGEVELIDRGGRRWTATLGPSGPTSWTLWREGEPILWWSGDGPQGVLSHRAGSQFRWRESVREPLAGDLAPLAVPPGFARGECGALP